MFVGGCAGSTGGGVKVIRWLMTFKIIIAELEVVRVAVMSYLGDHHTYPPDRNRGTIPPGLEAYLPEGYSFTTEYYVIDYDNWAPSEGFIGLTVITPDTVIGGAMIDILGPNSWSNGTDKFTWVIDWID